MKFKFVTISIALACSLLIGAFSTGANASNNENKSELGKAKVKTFVIRSNDQPETDSVKIKYDSSKESLTYDGLLTLRTGCDFIKSSKVSRINYFSQPSPSDPAYSLNVEVDTLKERACTQALKKARFNGTFNPVNFDQSKPLGNQIRLNVYFPQLPPNWFNSLDLSRFNWSDSTTDTVKRNGFTYKIEGTVLDRNKPVDFSKNCVGVRVGRIGPYCKTVTVSKNNKVILELKNIESFSKHFGEITNKEQLQFVSRAVQGSGFDLQTSIYNGHFLSRFVRECTNEVFYYEFNPKNYSKALLQSKIDKKVAVKCE